MSTLLIIVAAVLAALNLFPRAAAYWQVPVAVLLICLALLVGDAIVVSD